MMPTHDLHIRLARDDDARAIGAIYAPLVEDTTVSFEYRPPTAAELTDRIASRWPTHPWLVATDSRGTVLGYAYSSRFASRPAYDWTVETSVYIADSARGRGVGRALYERLLVILEAQGYRQALAIIALPNVGSVSLHEALGFAHMATIDHVGWKLGTWNATGYWHRWIGTGRSTDPSALLTLDELPPDLRSGASA